MRALLAFLVMLFGLSFSTLILAEAIEPAISKDVHVLKNVTPDQCPASWKGTANAADVTADTGQGVDNSQIASGVLSCESCAFDKASGDCVCKTCYGDYN